MYHPTAEIAVFFDQAIHQRAAHGCFWEYMRLKLHVSEYEFSLPSEPPKPNSPILAAGNLKNTQSICLLLKLIKQTGQECLFFVSMEEFTWVKKPLSSYFLNYFKI